MLLLSTCQTDETATKNTVTRQPSAPGGDATLKRSFDSLNIESNETETAAEPSPADCTDADVTTGRRWKSSRRRLSVVFNDNITVQGTWNFDLAQLGKLRYAVDENGERVPMTEAYEQAREKRIQRQVFDRWRSFRRPLEHAVAIEDDDIALQLQENTGCCYCDCNCMLPWWCIFLPWLMVVLTTVTCAFFTILYTFNFGRHKSLKWLRSLLTSFVSDVFFNQPLTILFVACFFTFIIKRSELEKLQLDVGAKADIDEGSVSEQDDALIEKQAISMLKLDPIYRPPPKVSVLLKLLNRHITYP